MSRQSLISALVKFGFTKNMASLYLAGLASGPVLMFTLAKSSNIKRSSAYYLMTELLRRGFFTKIKKGKRTFYLAALPEKLLKMTLERYKQIQIIFPQLKKIANSR